MTNVTRRENDSVYNEPSDFFKSSLELLDNFPNADRVGLCIYAKTDINNATVVIGVHNEEDMRALLYEMAVQSKLIKAGETLTLEGGR